MVWVRTSKLGRRLTVENASHIKAWIKRRTTKQHLCVTNYCVFGIYCDRLFPLIWIFMYKESAIRICRKCIVIKQLKLIVLVILVICSSLSNVTI